jgi:heme-degrading monooxygenase HmoA
LPLFVVVNRLQVPDAETGAQLEERFRSAGGRAGDVPGRLGFEFWRNAEGREYLVVTRWRSEADFDAWRRSEAFRQAHRDTGGSERVVSQLSRYEVVIAS